MSATPPAAPATSPPPATAHELTVISHSSLLYWWPVWAVGFLMGFLSLSPFDSNDSRMVIIPGKGTEVRRNVTGSLTEPKSAIELVTVKVEDQDVLVMPKHALDDRKGAPLENPLKLHAARSKNYGVLFATVLVLVILITNVPLRGGWSFALVVFAILLAIIFALAGWWEPILDKLHYLDIRINAGGYFFISGILFIMWAIVVLVFDQRIYMTFSPGQFKVCTEIGGGEKVYPAEGMALEKQRSDLFRHWILGLGSGDLIVKTTGAKAEHFDLHNVLFIGKKVKLIEEMMKRKVVIASAR